MWGEGLNFEGSGGALSRVLYPAVIPSERTGSRDLHSAVIPSERSESRDLHLLATLLPQRVFTRSSRS